MVEGQEHGDACLACTFGRRSAVRLRLASTAYACRPDDPLPFPERRGGKRIVQDGAGGYILPDGTRIAADERGGFRLPNGDYVTALANGLLLPNGTQCPADGAGGYVCP